MKTASEKAAHARKAFRSLIAEMRASGRSSYIEHADDLQAAVAETADGPLAKLYDFFNDPRRS